MSSIDPVESKAIGEELVKKGIHMMDAPVSGGEPKAIDGTLSVMAGGLYIRKCETRVFTAGREASVFTA